MFIFLTLLLSFLMTAYLYAVRNFDYWKKKGVISLKPTPFVGNLGPILLQMCSIGEFLKIIYNDYPKEPYVGVFLADKPCLIVRDLELVYRILKQDFAHFNKKILSIPKKTDPIGSKSLFVVHGTEWKNTRAKMSPIFTSKKQKVAFDPMMNVGKKFVDKLNEGNKIELKELAACVAVNMITDSVLGFDGNAIGDPENDILRYMGNKLFDEGLNQSTRTNIMFLAPEVMEFFGIYAFPKAMYDIMRDASDTAFKKKLEQGIRRGDYLEVLLETKEKGPWEGNNGEIIEADDDSIVSQLFTFFTAGYDTTSSGLTYCIYVMATRQDIQDKLRQELNETLEKNDGKMTYEALNNMKYLDNFINEVLRKHPPFPFLDRTCSRDYKIPGTDVVIDKGTKILLPMLGLQNDEKYFENPDVIIPERFDGPEPMKDKPYFPFSTGPRLCLGMRYVLQVIKVTLISCLKDHRLVVDQSVDCNLRMNPKKFGNMPLHDIPINVQRLNK